MKKQLRISLFAISFVCSLKTFGQNTVYGTIYDTDSLKIQQVSVGIGRNYVSVTLKAKASCSTWKSKLRELRSELEDILNE